MMLSLVQVCYLAILNLLYFTRFSLLKLFDQMKKMKITPERKVYNAVIHAFAKGKLVNEAVNLMKTMENDIAPNVVTYNSLIKPLCKTSEVDEAKEILDEMLQQGLSPTMQTYHVFFRILRTKDEVFALLKKKREEGCNPTIKTYIMLIRKFCRWRQLDTVFDVWSQMKMGEVNPDRSSYIVLIHGLFLNGKLEEAHTYYIKAFSQNQKHRTCFSHGFWGDRQEKARRQAYMSMTWKMMLQRRESRLYTKNLIEVDFLCQPETRRVVNEGEFSFWEQ